MLLNKRAVKRYIAIAENGLFQEQSRRACKHHSIKKNLLFVTYRNCWYLKSHFNLLRDNINSLQWALSNEIR